MALSYEKQQKALRAQVPKGTAGALELQKQGFTDVGTGTTPPTDSDWIHDPKTGFFTDKSGNIVGHDLLARNTDEIRSQTLPLQSNQQITNTLFRVPTQGIGPQGEQIYDVFAGQEHIADPNDPRLKGVDIAGLPEGQAPEGFQSKFQTGFQQANQALGGKAADVSGAQGSALVNQYSPARTNDFSSMFVQQDPFLGSLVAAFQEFVSPAQQRTSLREEYSKMVKETGIQQIDTEILDMKRILEGTTDDIRQEVTSAGGMATESQVIALSNARSRQLIKNYNQLIDLRNSKEKYLQTSLRLEQADRQMADQRFSQMFDMSTQIFQLQQQMKKNAIESLDRTISAVGWSGLANIVSPYEAGLIEQAYGLPQGGLLQAAQRERQILTQAEEERQLGLQEQQLGIQLKRADLAAKPLDIQERKLALQLKGEQIKTEQAQRAKIVADTQKIINSQKGSILDPNTPEGAKQLALNKSKVDQIGNILSSRNLKTAVGPSIFSRYGTIRRFFRPGDYNFIGDVEQLRSQLSLQSLIDAKSQGATFGALSDQELQILSTAGTKIGSWVLKDKNNNVTGYRVKESDFRAELDKVNNFAKLDYIYRGGNPEDIGVLVIDGKYYTKNSNGSVTEL